MITSPGSIATSGPSFIGRISTIIFATLLVSRTFRITSQRAVRFDFEKLSCPPVINQRAVKACEKRCVGRHYSGELFVEELPAELAASLEPMFTARLREHNHQRFLDEKRADKLLKAVRDLRPQPYRRKRPLKMSKIIWTIGFPLRNGRGCERGAQTRKIDKILAR